MSFALTSSAATKSPNKVIYTQYTDYNKEVLPKLDQGYTVVKHDNYVGPKNKTKDAIIKAAKALRSNLVMVKSDFGYDTVSFNIYYLKNTKNVTGFGAETVPMPLHIRQNFHSNDGCTLGEIDYASPAYNADLHKDDVIVKVNDILITSCKKFHNSIRNKKTVKLNVWADNKTYDIELKLQTK